MCSGGSDWTCLQPGFPIRKSSDHSLVIDYPRLIADSYVLLRFLVPRHPPCALKNLNTTKDARVHCEVLNIQPAPHTRDDQRHPLGGAHDQKNQPAHTSPAARHPHERGRPPPGQHASPDPSGPNNVSRTPTPTTP